MPTEGGLPAIEAAKVEDRPSDWETFETAASAVADVVEFIQRDSHNYIAGRQGCALTAIVVRYTGAGASALNNL